VDAFILARLEAAGQRPSPPADKLTLLRRAYLDLVGLPPSPEEQDAFLADSSPGAYEKAVDRLLSTPQYGERWAQHWLDVVRFAESNGYEADGDRPHAWRYRDYVAASFNADKPYNRFLTEQLAGDELAAGKDPRTAADLWVATGLHRCGPVHLISGNVDPEPIRQEVLTEYAWGVSAAVLGLTINCARCHDHKFDPVSQADYYRLQAFFAGAQFKEVEFATPEEKQAYKDRVAALTAKIGPLQAQVEAIDGPQTHDRCVIGFAKCSDEMPCAQHDLYKPIRQRIKDYLTTTTAADLAASLRAKQAWQRLRVAAGASAPSTGTNEEVRTER